MTGLQYEIESRNKHRQRMDSGPITYAGIARILKTSYPTAKRKIENNSFTVPEALLIFNTLFKANSKFEAFEYLFTEKE